MAGVTGRSLAVALAGLALTAASAQARDIVVNDDATGYGPAGANCAAPERSSIQGGIAAASPGDRILVCSGRYAEASGAPAAVVDRPVTILGPAADFSYEVSPPDYPTVNAMVQDEDGAFDVQAPGVTINGFFIEGTYGPAIAVRPPASGAAIISNRFYDTSSDLDIDLDGGAIVRGNLFNYSQDEPNVRIADFDGLALRDNTGAPWISVEATEGDPAKNLEVVENSTLRRVDLANAHGAVLEGNGAHTFGGLSLLGGNRDVRIVANDFGPPAWEGAGITLASTHGPPNAGISVLRNNFDRGELTERMREVAIHVDVDAMDDILHVEQNRLAYPGGAIAVQGGARPVDAENNWWGCNAGPGAPECSQIDGDRAIVDSDPHLLFTLDGTRPVPTIGWGWTVPAPGLVAELRLNSAGQKLEGGVGSPALDGRVIIGPRVPYWLDSIDPVLYPGPHGVISMQNGIGYGSVYGSTLSPDVIHATATLDAATVETDVHIPDLDECESYSDYFYRGSGEDESVDGTPKTDSMNGFGGDDSLRGRGESDCLAGMGGKDRLIGGDGKDYLVGAGGRNLLRGGKGSDLINSKNGKRDVVKCGPRRDYAVADRIDRLSDCERRRTAFPGPGRVFKAPAVPPPRP